MRSIIELERQGYEVSVNGETVKIEKRPDAMPDAERVRELLSVVKEHKQEAITFLTDRWFDNQIQAVIEEFDKAGITVHNTTEEARQDALQWEDRLTAAANNYDVQAFQEALSRWKEAWFADIRARDRF